MTKVGMSVLKLIALLAAMCLGAGTALATAATGPGDTSGTAIDINASGLPYTSPTSSTCGMSDDFTNGSSGGSGGGSPCSDLPGSYNGPDIFYQITLGDGNHVSFSTQDSTGDLALFLVNANMSTCAATSVDVKGVADEEITFPYTYPAGTYYLIVDSVTPGDCGAYTLLVTGNLGAVDGGVSPADSGIPIELDAGTVDVAEDEAGSAGADGPSAVDAPTSETGTPVGADAAGDVGSGAAGGSSGAGGAVGGSSGAGGGIVPPPWWPTGGTGGPTGSGGGTPSPGPDAGALDAAGGGSGGAGGGVGGNGGVGGLSGTGGTDAGLGGTPGVGATGGAGGALDAGGTGGFAGPDASPLSDAVRADAPHGADATSGAFEAGANDGLARLDNALPFDAHGGPSSDATASDGHAEKPAVSGSSGCKCDTGRSSNRTGNFAGGALLLGALLLRRLRRRHS
jgi:MYXO-CTERM domain-containing protein